eukprot:6222839-Prymnesium_polylepis.1
MDATAVRAASSQPMPTPLTVTQSARAQRPAARRSTGRRGTGGTRWLRRAACPRTSGAGGA